LADLVGYSRQYVSRAERPSKGLASADLVGVIDAALAADGALVGLHASLNGQRLARRVRASATPNVLVHVSRASAVNAKTTRLVSGRGPDIHEEIAVAGEEAARFVRRAGVSVSTELVEQLESDVRRLASDYLIRPPFHMFHPLAELRAEVFDILDRHPRLEFLRDLYSLGGPVAVKSTETVVLTGLAVERVR